MTLTGEQAALLARMRGDNGRSPAPYAALGHWQRIAIDLQTLFDALGIGDVEEQRYNEYYSAYPPSFGCYDDYARALPRWSDRQDGESSYAYACRLLYERIKREDQGEAYRRVKSALPASSPRVVMLDGRPYSWDVLISLDSILALASVSPALLTGPCVVADLGAGWGRIGFVLKQINRRATYVIFDLPETLLVSSDYLPRVLPKVKAHGYDETRGYALDRNSLDDGAIWFAGSHDLPRVANGAIDYFISIGSFQEMPPAYVDAYFDTVDRVTDGYFYTLQHRRVVHYGRERYGNHFPFKAHWTQHLMRPVSWCGDYFEAVHGV